MIDFPLWWESRARSPRLSITNSSRSNSADTWFEHYSS
jgi:hypothetical protein